VKRFLFGFLLLTITACTTMTQVTEPGKPTSTTALYPDLGLAPELTNDTWLNVESPLRLADLRGKVVAIDMWTFG
jgi:hypothetical protein